MRFISEHNVIVFWHTKYYRFNINVTINDPIISKNKFAQKPFQIWISAYNSHLVYGKGIFWKGRDKLTKIVYTKLDILGILHL